LKTEIETAKGSNDPTKMRAALDKAEQALTTMDTHMSNCMGVMHGMHMMGGQNSETQQHNEPPKE
jgi:hypothetical protein